LFIVDDVVVVVVVDVVYASISSSVMLQFLVLQFLLLLLFVEQDIASIHIVYWGCFVCLFLVVLAIAGLYIYFVSLVHRF
jgi:hypothetical protein